MLLELRRKLQNIHMQSHFSHKDLQIDDPEAPSLSQASVGRLGRDYAGFNLKRYTEELHSAKARARFWEVAPAQVKEEVRLGLLGLPSSSPSQAAVQALSAGWIQPL